MTQAPCNGVSANLFFGEQFHVGPRCHAVETHANIHRFGVHEVNVGTTFASSDSQSGCPRVRRGNSGNPSCPPERSPWRRSEQSGFRIQPPMLLHGKGNNEQDRHTQDAPIGILRSHKCPCLVQIRKSNVSRVPEVSVAAKRPKNKANLKILLRRMQEIAGNCSGKFSKLGAAAGAKPQRSIESSQQCYRSESVNLESGQEDNQAHEVPAESISMLSNASTSEFALQTPWARQAARCVPRPKGCDSRDIRDSAGEATAVPATTAQ